jgi:Ca2+-binding RTX toxin-like protein
MFNGMLRLLVATTALCALALPASALAAEVHIEGSTLVYTAAPGETNVIEISDSAPSPDDYAFSDSTPSTTVTAPCARNGAAIVCPGADLTGARFDLGDGDDRLVAAGGSTSGKVLPLTVNGGDGSDTVIGTSLADVLDGGAGNDSLPGAGGDDVITGGPGDDDVRPQDGNDTADGGPGDDFVNGGSGDDKLKSGGGADDRMVGGPGNDVLDLQNGETDIGELAACDEGDDTILLDPKDQILEHKDGRAIVTEPSCEHVLGQTAAPKPLHVFAAGKTKVVVDLVDALPTTITVEIRAGKKLLARGTGKRTGARTTLTVKLTPSGRHFNHRAVVVARVTVVDTGGRRSVTTTRL